MVDERVKPVSGELAPPRQEERALPRVGDALKRSLRGDLEPGTPIERVPAGWPSKRFTRLIGLAVGIAFLLGLTALATWTWGSAGPIDWPPQARPMLPVTAAGLMTCSATVALLALDRKVAGKVLALSCIFIGVAILSFASIPLGEAFLLRTLGDQASLSLGRLAVMPGSSLVLFGIAALTITARKSGRRTIGVTCGTAGLAIALLSVLGNMLLAGKPLNTLDAVLVMPVHTAIGLAAIFAALLLVRPQASWVGILLANDSRARIARILLVSAVIPAPLGWLAERGHRVGLYGADARLVLIVSGAVLLLAMLALAAAVIIGDERRDRLEIARALDLSPNILQDLDGTILYWSKGCENLYGWTAEETVGRDCAAVLGACAPDFKRIDTLLLENDAWQGELQHRTRDGRTLWVSARWVLFRRGEGQPPITLMSLNDVTKERQAQAAVQERDARLLQLQAEVIEVSRLTSMGEMAAALAHELNQPLTAAANFLGVGEMVLARAGTAPDKAALGQVENVLSRAKDEALRAGDIVRRLREFISRGEADMRRESLPAIINNAVLLGLASVEQKTIDVEYSLSPQAEYVLADRVQIQQVIVNIVRNAAEAMAQTSERPRRLRITTAAVDERLAEIVISDTGPGLSDEVGESLFTPFSSTKATGMGVGLSICKRIVEAHGGDICALNRPGEGAEFRFTLPLFNRAEESDDQS